MSRSQPSSGNSVARQQYHAATDRYGRNASPSSSSARGFGASGKASDLFPHFGFTADNVAKQLERIIKR